MRLSAEQIESNWSELRKLINDTFEGERLEKDDISTCIW